MASKEQIQELKDKVGARIDSEFGGDWYKGYQHYANLGGNNIVERKQLLVLLEDAGIGSWLTRGAWADGIMEELDTNTDKQLSWTEFEKVLRD